MQYSLYLINIYVFYYKEESSFLLQMLLNFKKKELTRLHLRKFYGLKSLLKTRGIKLKATFLMPLFLLVVKILIAKIYMFFFKKKFYLVSPYFKLKASLIKKSIRKTFFLKKKKKTKRKKYYLLSFFKLKYINYLIKFKYLGLFCTLLISFYTTKSLKVNLKSIVEKSLTFIRFPFFFKFLKNYVLKQKLYLVLLSFLFLKANILTSYINIIIKKTRNKKHVKNLIMFFNNIKMLFEKQIISLFGLKFKIAGRLGGKLRKGSFIYKLGAVRLMSFNVVLDYSCTFVYTQYGSFSLKL